jgi:hypothetical protein
MRQSACKSKQRPHASLVSSQTTRGWHTLPGASPAVPACETPVSASSCDRDAESCALPLTVPPTAEPWKRLGMPRGMLHRVSGAKSLTRQGNRAARWLASVQDRRSTVCAWRHARMSPLVGMIPCAGQTLSRCGPQTPTSEHLSVQRKRRLLTASVCSSSLVQLHRSWSCPPRQSSKRAATRNTTRCYVGKESESAH